MEEVYQEADFDEFLDSVGPCAKFLRRFYVIAAIVALLGGALFIASTVLTTGDPKFQCSTPELVKTIVNQTCQKPWGSYQDNLTVPWDEKSKTHDHCQRLVLTPVLVPVNCSYWFPSEGFDSNVTGPQFAASNLETEKCEKWTYNENVFYSTIESDFDLVCDNKWKAQFSTLLLMTGFLIGALISGILSDKFGRKPIFMTSSILLCVFGLLSSFSSSYWQFALLQTCIGGTYIGFCMAGYVLGMEFTAIKPRAFIGPFLMTAFSFAIMLLGGLGYFVRSWRTFVRVTSVPLLITVFVFGVLGRESPRWLHAKKRDKEAAAVIIMLKKASGYSDNKNEALLQNGVLNANNEEKEEEAEQKNSLLDLVKNPTMIKISLMLCYNWFAITCVYYGLTLNSSKIAGNVFLNLFLTGLVEIPASLVSMLLLYKWRRRPFLFLCHILSGTALVSMGAVPRDLVWLNMSLFLIGKFGATASFNSIYVFSSELYPTPHRGTGMGCCSCCARLGGIISIPIIMMMEISVVLPFIIFGVIALFAGVLVGFLPETHNTPLPETIEECEEKYRNKSLFFLPNRKKRGTQGKKEGSREFAKHEMSNL